MNTVIENRRQNFRRIVSDLGGPRESAIKLDMAESQVSQLISDHINKNMGHKLARKIEKALGLPINSLDLEAGVNGRQPRSVPIVGDEDAGSDIFAEQHFEDIMTRKRVIWDNSNPYMPIGPLVAFYLPDDALGSAAHRGDLAIFDCWPVSKGAPERVTIGAFVLIEHNGQILCRIVKQSAQGGYDFIADSDLFAPIHKDSADCIKGVLVEVRWLRPRIMK